MSCDLNTIKAAEKDFCYYSGDNIRYSFYVFDLDGLPVDLSADTLIMQVKRRKTDPITKAVAVLSTTAGTITVSGVSKNLISLSGKYALDQDTYYHDMERSVIEETVIFGKFLATGDVTRTI